MFSLNLGEHVGSLRGRERSGPEVEGAFEFVTNH